MLKGEQEAGLNAGGTAEHNKYIVSRPGICNRIPERDFFIHPFRNTKHSKERRRKGGSQYMANIISDETIEYVGILAKLELSDEEKETAKKDMGRMLDYIDKLNELDTSGVEPMSHVFPMNNVFREDVVTNGDERDKILLNAPEQKDGAFKVPKTVE